jgi:hypothetical protein
MEFLKKKKETFNDEIVKHAKLYKSPAPGEYNNMPKYKVLSVPKQTGEQRMLIYDSQYKGMQVPGAKYDHSCYTKVKPRVLALKIIAPKDKKGLQWKIVKSKDPDMGSYKDEESFKKTQITFEKHNLITTKSNRTSFIDIAVRSKKNNLAPSHYKSVTDGFEKLSKPQFSSRRRL